MNTSPAAQAGRWACVAFILVAVWQCIIWATQVPPYILPSPGMVAISWLDHRGVIAAHAGTTIVEILLGLTLGAVLGMLSAMVISHFRPARHWLLPVLVASQSVPVFAIAPLLVLWLGYGMASKVAMATLIIFFPVTAAFLDGLRRTDPGWVDLAHTMMVDHGARRFSPTFSITRHVRIPAALPALASGMRIATAIAPIGAVVGEWVGSSSGLGYLMLHANARMQVDLMFAALFTLGVFSITLWFCVDTILRRCIPWQTDTFGDTR